MYSWEKSHNIQTYLFNSLLRRRKLIKLCIRTSIRIWRCCVRYDMFSHTSEKSDTGSRHEVVYSPTRRSMPSPVTHNKAGSIKKSSHPKPVFRNTLDQKRKATTNIPSTGKTTAAATTCPLVFQSKVVPAVCPIKVAILSSIFVKAR